MTDSDAQTDGDWDEINTASSSRDANGEVTTTLGGSSVSELLNPGEGE